MRFLAILLLLPLFSNSQIANGIDSMAEYSLRLALLGPNDTVPFTATGFLVRKNKKLYLVTNYHVFTNTNSIQRTYNKGIKCDSMIIPFKRLNGTSYFKTISINAIQKTHKPIFYGEQADIFLCPIELPKDVVIHSIEGFINQLNVTPDKIFTIGFPSDKLGIPEKIDFQVKDDFLSPFNTHTPEGKEITVTNSYLLSPNSRGGFSGSPVFFISKNKIYFGGVLSSHTNVGSTMVVKPVELIIKLKQL